MRKGSFYLKKVQLKNIQKFLFKKYDNNSLFNFISINLFANRKTDDIVLNNQSVKLLNLLKRINKSTEEKVPISFLSKFIVFSSENK